MPNVFKAVIDAIQSLVDIDHKPPLHIGEVTSAWMYLATLREAVIYEQIGLNTTTDTELSKLLQDAANMCVSQAEKLEQFLTQEGVPLPPTSERKPKCESKDIPLGVKLTDDEIANGLSIKIATGVTECAAELSNAIRPDFALMFAGFLGEHIAFGSTLKHTMHKRGWLKIPPYYVPPGLPTPK